MKIRRSLFKKKVRYCWRTLSVFTVDIVFVGPLGQALDQLSCPEFVLAVHQLGLATPRIYHFIHTVCALYRVIKI